MQGGYRGVIFSLGHVVHVCPCLYCTFACPVFSFLSFLLGNNGLPAAVVALTAGACTRHANTRGKRFRPLGPLRTMSTSTLSTTEQVRSDAQKRVITIKTEADDIVTYSGNPAELPGIRHEIRLAMRRAGAFKMLVTNNASRLPNGLICVDHIDNIPFVTELVEDPNADLYSYEAPCPGTQARVTVGCQI